MSKSASRIASNPLDFIGGGAPSVRPLRGEPEPAEDPAESPVVLKTYRLPVEVVNKVADIAHAERCTMADFVAQAIGELVARLEERRGEPYPLHPKARPKAPSTLWTSRTWWGRGGNESPHSARGIHGFARIFVWLPAGALGRESS